MSTGISESVITLPDILAEWPWKRNLNPLSHLQTEAESTAWTRSFVVFTPRLQQALELGDHRARRRFIEGLYKFTTAVVDQAHDRDKNYIKNVDEYFLVRRNTIGAMPAFAVLEFSLNLPDEVFEDPDIYSYNVEQARGDANHNLVTILMHHKNLSLAETMKWIGDYASKIVSEFLDDLNHVPSFGEGVECDLERYLYGIANWVRANDCWSFECRRYFETNGLQIQQTRKVDLLPRYGISKSSKNAVTLAFDKIKRVLNILRAQVWQ
ncbi:hypothetical protein C0989_000805 [Termitomyces sp. Mn162]|nr:hypothetical protein C0989_000805 [Termitomyces sp. Mn162]